MSSLKNTLNGDGLLDKFYSLLWYKIRMKEIFEFNLPHTIVFEFKTAKFWYYTNDNQQIVRRRSENITNTNIRSVFNKFENLNINCYFIHYDDKE